MFTSLISITKGCFFLYLFSLFEAIMTNSIPVKANIKKCYDKYYPYLNATIENIHNFLMANIKLSAQPTYKVRVKNFDSYYKKLLRQKPKEAVNSEELVCITDMMGIRIICAFLEDIEGVLEQLKKLFSVKEIEKKGASQNFKEFGYESVHVLVSIPSSCLPSNMKPSIVFPPDLVCEIQIRTILQDAWAEVEHELIYKSEFTPFDMPLRRKLASMNASLSLADIIFQEIRDYQKKLQNELNQRRTLFYNKADDLIEIGKQTSHLDIDDNIERVTPYVSGTIDDLILQAIHAHNTGDITRAIYIYTKILEASPRPNKIVLSVIHKHRGMAHFTQNNYNNALKDFKASYDLDKNNFRAVYYEGIVYSIQKKYKEALECFTKSLQINKYQSHAFFRRAIANYELNDYESAMNDLATAKKLGLEDKESSALQAKLLEKFDMKM